MLGWFEARRGAGSDHEIAPCSILLRFETPTSRSETDNDGGRGAGRKTGAIVFRWASQVLIKP